MERIHKSLGTAIVLSEVTHVFCCVLPTIVSILSLLAGMGVISVVPGFLDSFHDVMHDFEKPVIIGSGAILMLGWVLYMISARLDCVKEAGCQHVPCGPKKKKTSKLLIVATFLFAINVTVYVTLHKPYEAASPAGVQTVDDDLHNHHGHSH